MNPNERQPQEQGILVGLPEAHEALSPAVDDPRIVEALDQYLAAIENGEKPNRQAFLARHADIAGTLAECLDGLDALQAASSSGRPSSAHGGVTGTSVDLQPEAPLGDFRIVREIGRGGMGVVYEAVQLSLGRRVALKVLPFAAALDGKQLQRFKNEAQAAAHLHHTNIVPVYAVGAERGVHFYAMQLIEGQNLAALIGDLRGRAAPASSGSHSRPEAEPTGPYPPLSPPLGVSLTPPSPPAGGDSRARRMAETRSNLGAQLSTQRSDGSPEFFRTVVRLVMQVAEALDYAHGMGIIHRDIKPANLLVDARGNVWVTDFGLAQFHADAGLTQTGDLVGTLRYMSPEQAGGPRTLIDHRTDVYSLGATIYELLTLRPIFDGTDRQSLLHQILHEEPRLPRSMDRSIPPELETIVLKAISKVPAERYATARDFADDLQRFLRHEPIRARRATPVQRARKWLRRHPSVLAAAVVLLVLLTASSLFSAWLIRGEQEKTRIAYEREKKQFQIARQSVDDMIQLAEAELADKPHMEGLRKRLLEAALTYYQEFIELRRDEPDAPRAELTATQDHVQKILDELLVLQGADQLHLLTKRAVLDDLRLSTKQQEQIRTLADSLAGQRLERFREFHRMTPEEQQQRFVEAQNNEKAVEQILSDEQLGRFKQIALQAQGPRAFREREVETGLKLTAEQKARIFAILADSFFVMLEQGCHDGPPDKPPPPDKLPKAHDQNFRAATERIEALLTPAQAKRWREMTGEPFKEPTSLRPPPRLFGPPGPKGPRGPFGPPR